MVYKPLKVACEITGLAYQTLKNWNCQGKLPFPVYGTPRKPMIKESEVLQWMELTRREPCRSQMERIRI